MTTETTHNGCDCTLCQNNRAFRKHIALIPEEERPFFEEVYDELLNTQMDRDYYKAIMSGKWTNAVEILENALARAKAYQNEAATKEQSNDALVTDPDVQ